MVVVEWARVAWGDIHLVISHGVESRPAHGLHIGNLHGKLHLRGTG